MPKSYGDDKTIINLKTENLQTIEKGLYQQIEDKSLIPTNITHMARTFPDIPIN